MGVRVLNFNPITKYLVMSKVNHLYVKLHSFPKKITMIIIWVNIQSIMFVTLRKKNSIKIVLKWLFSGFSFFFIAMLFSMIIHDAMTGVSSTTAEYCAKYGILASPACW